jgi:hypothetical protein
MAVWCQPLRLGIECESSLFTLTQPGGGYGVHHAVRLHGPSL